MSRGNGFDSFGQMQQQGQGFSSGPSKGGTGGFKPPLSPGATHMGGGSGGTLGAPAPQMVDKTAPKTGGTMYAHGNIGALGISPSMDPFANGAPPGTFDNPGAPGLSGSPGGPISATIPSGNNPIFMGGPNMGRPVDPVETISLPNGTQMPILQGDPRFLGLTEAQKVQVIMGERPPQEVTPQQQYDFTSSLPSFNSQPTSPIMGSPGGPVAGGAPPGTFYNPGAPGGGNPMGGPNMGRPIGPAPTVPAQQPFPEYNQMAPPVAGGGVPVTFDNPFGAVAASFPPPIPSGSPGGPVAGGAPPGFVSDGKGGFINKNVFSMLPASGDPNFFRNDPNLYIPPPMLTLNRQPQGPLPSQPPLPKGRPPVSPPNDYDELFGRNRFRQERAQQREGARDRIRERMGGIQSLLARGLDRRRGMAAPQSQVRPTQQQESFSQVIAGEASNERAPRQRPQGGGFGRINRRGGEGGFRPRRPRIPRRRR